MTRRAARTVAALAAVLALALAPPPVDAQRRTRREAPPAIVDQGPAHLIVADGWTVADPGPGAATGPGSGPAILRRDGAVMIVTRQAAPNPQAWSRATRDAHVDDLVAGFTAGGATELAREVTTEGASRTPVLDLTLARGGRVVAVRVILFRTLTVAAAADGGGRAVLERAVGGLHPDR